MTIVDKPLEKSDLESVRGNRSGALASFSSSGDMDGSCSSWAGGSSTSDPPRAKTPCMGPTPGATLYSAVTAAVSSAATTTTAAAAAAASTASSTPLPSERPKEQVQATSADGIALPQKVLFPAERLNLKWTQMHRIGAGLQNLGNTCFLNSALQCLSYTPPLANYMLSREHSKTCHEPGFCMMCTMQNHITQVFANSGNVIKPIAVLNDLKRIAKHFRFGSQEDAHEFLRYTVDAMQKSCLPGNKLDRQTQATTLIHQIFGGYLRSRVKCLNCKAVSDTFDPYLDVALDIKTAPTISKALEQFVKPEQLDGENAYKCTKCKKMVPASKRFTIHRSSNVLTISLKRFANYNGGKIAKDVRYCEYLDLRPYMSQPHGDPLVYSLYAVLVHSGFSCHAGHYYCYVKASNGQWFQMNDSSVSVSDIRSVLNQQAYVLFYIRCHDVKNGGGEVSPVIHTPPRPVLSVRGLTVNRPAVPSNSNGPPRLLKIGPQVNGRAYHSGFRYGSSAGGSSSSTLTKTGSSLSSSSSSASSSYPAASSSSSSSCSSSSSSSYVPSRPTEIADPDKRQKLSFLIGQGKSVRPGLSQPGSSSTSGLSHTPLSSSSSSSSVAASSSSSSFSTMHSTSDPSSSSSSSSSSGSKLNGAPYSSSSGGPSIAASALLVPYGQESSEESDQEGSSNGGLRHNGQTEAHGSAKQHANGNGNGHSHGHHGMSPPAKRHAGELMSSQPKTNGSSNVYSNGQADTKPSQNGHHKVNGVKVNGNGHMTSPSSFNGRDAEFRASPGLSKPSKIPDASAGMSVPSVGKNGHQSPPHTSDALQLSGEVNASSTSTSTTSSSSQLGGLSALAPASEAAGDAQPKLPEALGNGLQTSKDQLQLLASEAKQHQALNNGSGDGPSASEVRPPPTTAKPVHVNGLNGRPEAGDPGTTITTKHRDAGRDDGDRDWSRNARLSDSYFAKDRERDRERERDSHHRHHHNQVNGGGGSGGDKGRDRDGYSHRGDRESRRPRSGSRERERYHRDSDRYWDRHRSYRERDRDRDHHYRHHRHRSRGERERERDYERDRERRPVVGEYNHHHSHPHRGSGSGGEGSGSGRCRWGEEEGRGREEELSSGSISRAKQPAPPSASSTPGSGASASASGKHADRKRSLQDDHSEERPVKKHKKSKKNKKNRDKHRSSDLDSPERTSDGTSAKRKKKKKKKKKKKRRHEEDERNLRRSSSADERPSRKRRSRSRSHERDLSPQDAKRARLDNHHSAHATPSAKHRHMNGHAGNSYSSGSSQEGDGSQGFCRDAKYSKAESHYTPWPYPFPLLLSPTPPVCTCMCRGRGVPFLLRAEGQGEVVGLYTPPNRGTLQTEGYEQFLRMPCESPARWLQVQRPN
ncbi:hypothetical protein ACEWY4_025879 [Coilia grayii]|uniref:ubiquitinyl hydrolase 1 n=1 Tax=Coilia grayii TaxID=363190 RepID=A0ABD1IT77_9TELE